MRDMNAPSENPIAVFHECMNSISDINLQSRLNAITVNISDSANEYLSKAPISQLFTIIPNNSQNDAIVLNGVTKKELKDLYTSHMVPRSKPARNIYDSILSRAPLGRCPFCGFGHASTLDHYLPKSKYPQLSVLPQNLVPSCTDCNTGKHANIAASEEQQSLHPYFDHGQFINEQWLFAEVVQSTPVTIRYYVKAPAHWTDISRSRVETHFRSFDLSKRYSVEASDHLTYLRNTLQTYLQISGPAAVKQHLSIESQSYSQKHRNSWQTAMFQALAESNWYCNGGFI
jgi:hypothetical protein